MGEVLRRTKNGKFIGYYLRFYEGGRRRVLASKQPTLAEARRLLQAIEGRIARGRAGLDEPRARPSCTVGDLCERFLREFSSPRVKCMQGYRRAARYGLGRLLPLVGGIELAALSRADLERARGVISRRYRSNTVRAAFRPLSTALSWAVRQELIPHNPAHRMELPRKERSLEHLSAVETRQLLAAAEQRARSGGLIWQSRLIALSLALRLGLRRGEIFGLRWQDVDLARGQLVVARSYRLAPKSGKPRHLPIPQSLASALRAWQPRCPATVEGLLCPVFYRTWKMSSPRATHGLAELLRAAGCRPLARGWHSLRHTFASTFVQSGGSLAALQQVLGHSDIATSMIYAHFASDFLAAELAKTKL